MEEENTTMNARLSNFAYTLLEAQMPVVEVYQECMGFAKALEQRDISNIAAYCETTADLMEIVATALLDAQRQRVPKI